jgi:hypothetical protein
MKTNKAYKAIFISVLLVSLLMPYLSAGAAADDHLPAFADFTSAVIDGQSGIIRGVYVPGVLADRVVTQNPDNPGYVSQMAGVVTQFGMAIQYQVIGLLAHNFLAGESFSNLQIGQEVRIIYGDGRVDYYIVSSIKSFQALQPDSLYSNFVDLDTNVIYTAQQTFSMFYQAGGNHVTFQTCIRANGNSSWGRLFVTAVPASFYYYPETREVQLKAR